MEKITIVLPHLEFGGTERAAVELANYLAKNERNVSILLMFNRPVQFDLFHTVTLIEPPKNLQKKIGKFLFIFYVIWFLRQRLKKNKTKTVIALGYISITLFATLGLDLRVIVSGRSSPSRVRFPKNLALNWFYLFSNRLLRKRVNGIIAQTNMASEKYKKDYRCPIKVIPNFLREINDYHFDRKNQIITVGRCVPEKAQHYLIMAFAKLNAPDWNLVIVGDGPRKKQLEELAKNVEVNHRINFTSFQKDVDFFLAQSKIFVLTSIIEGFPNALIEAMANGLAPVSFDCNAGPSDIIQEGENGFLIEEGNVEALAKRIQDLINDPELLISIAEKAKKTRENYHISKIGKNYFDFIQFITYS